jgi:thioredoxin 2
MSTHIVHCPSCGAANRIPENREAIQGRCGSCHNLLPPLYCHPQQLTDQSFDTFIRGYGGPVLAEFWAPW